MRYQVQGLRRDSGVPNHPIETAQYVGYRHTRAQDINWKTFRSHPMHIHTCIHACLHKHADDGDEDVHEDKDDIDRGEDGGSVIMLPYEANVSLFETPPFTMRAVCLQMGRGGAAAPPPPPQLVQAC